MEGKFQTTGKFVAVFEGVAFRTKGTVSISVEL